MLGVQQRLQLKQVQIDVWSTKEQLCLASAVVRSGDQNWVSVSRSIKMLGDPDRPADWFSQKNCALQYSSLLEKVDTPKRKRGEKGEIHIETPGESIVRKLTMDRIEELKKQIDEGKSQYLKLKEDSNLVLSGQADDRLQEILQEIEKEKQAEKEAAEKWQEQLQEREKKKLAIQQALKQQQVKAVTLPIQKKKVSRAPFRRNSNQSEVSSENESVLDSPTGEQLTADVLSDESAEPVSKPANTPTSPLLTNLLKTPVSATGQYVAPVLSGAFTPPTPVAPKSSTTVNTEPGSENTISVSSGLKNLVSSAIAGTSDSHSETAVSTTSGSPTLSMLLELPPSAPGQPLPEIATIMSQAASNSSTVSEDQSTATSAPQTTQQPVEEPPKEAADSVLNIPAEDISKSDVEMDVPVVVTDDESVNETVKEEVIPEILNAVVEAVDKKEETQVPIKSESSADELSPVKPVDVESSIAEDSDVNTEMDSTAAAKDIKSEDSNKEETVAVETSEQTTDPSIIADAETEENTESSEQAPEEKEKTPERSTFTVKEEHEGAPEAKNRSTARRSAASRRGTKFFGRRSTRRRSRPVSESPKDGKTDSVRTSESNSEVATDLDEPDKLSVKKEPAVEETAPEAEVEEDTEPTVRTTRRRTATVSTPVSTPHPPTLPNTPIDSIPNSPASTVLSDDDREYRTWKKSIMLVWSGLACHKYASVFLKPITNDQATGYHNVVMRPMDLSTIKKNIENGVIRTTAQFQRDVMLMFLNAIMYNSSDHDIYPMILTMRKDCLQHIQEYLNTQMLVQKKEVHKTLRRETRETMKRGESSADTEVVDLPTAKRKRSSYSGSASSLSSGTEERSSKKRRVQE